MDAGSFMKIYSDYNLSDKNTMALCCHASFAVALDNDSTLADDILSAIDFARNRNLSLLVLSGGSNVLLPTRLSAVVLLPKICGITVLDDSDTHVRISVAGGENWHDFIQTCLDSGWYGLENLALIPGLVGASPVQNIGAYGVQVSDFISEVIAYDLTDGTRQVFTSDECQFDYRDSFFKKNPNNYLISHVVFTLHKDPTCVLTNYGDLAVIAQDFATLQGRSTPTPQDIYHAVVQIRQNKLPNPAVLPNCGSFFQNPIIKLEQFTILKERHPELPSYPIDDTVIKIPAGWLIDQAGLKGKGVAPIFTHTEQALVLTNHAPHHATQADISAAQDFITQTVYDKFGVRLVREPVWVHADGR